MEQFLNPLVDSFHLLPHRVLALDKEEPFSVLLLLSSALRASFCRVMSQPKGTAWREINAHNLQESRPKGTAAFKLLSAGWQVGFALPCPRI